MKTYIVRVTETIDHAYEVEAENEEAALAVFDAFTPEQIANDDLEGGRNWDVPWSVEEQS